VGGENTTNQDLTRERVRGIPGGRPLSLGAVTVGLLVVTALASRRPLRIPGRSGGAAAGARSLLVTAAGTAAAVIVVAILSRAGAGVSETRHEDDGFCPHSEHFPSHSSTRRRGLEGVQTSVD
jgi:hypothetical protein